MLCELFDFPVSMRIGNDGHVWAHHEYPCTAMCINCLSRSRSSAARRGIVSMLQEKSTAVGRFKVNRLMQELGLIYKQPCKHVYKRFTDERIDIANE